MLLAPLKYIFDGILDLFFPCVCPCCENAITTPQRPVCDECMDALPRTPQNAKYRKRVEEIFSAINIDFPTPRFIRGAAFCLFYKNEKIRPLIHKAKFSNQPPILQQLAMQAAKEYAPNGFFDDIDYLIPIPLHPKRMRERGYNQCEFIARGLNEITAIPIALHFLKRTKNNPKQSKQKHDDRKKNVERIFDITTPENLVNKHILLIDDVLTSGATMYSAMQPFLTIEGCKISIFAIALSSE